MHKLSSISIYNFKSCKRLEDIALTEFTPLVGYNNAGKSNVLEAITWLLRRYSLQESDFYDPAEPVSMFGEIRGLTPAVLDNLGGTHRTRMEPFVAEEAIRIRRDQARPGVPATEAKIKVRDPSMPANDPAAWRDNPAGIENAISALFPEPIVINAMEDAGKDIGKNDSTSTIGKLIAKLLASVRTTQGDEIARQLAGIRTLLDADGDNRPPELTEFDVRANAIVGEFFPGVRVKVHVPAPDIAAVFKAGTLKVYECHATGDADPIGRDVTSLGHGAQRAIQMSLIRQLSETVGAGANGCTLLLIDEPELYMHPQAVAKVQSALRKLSRGAYQVIFTTHSPLMIGRDELGSVLVLCKSREAGTTTRRRLADALEVLEDDARAQLDELFSLDAASQILFSDRTVLAEGKTERDIIPDLFTAHFGTSLADRRIGFVPIDGSGNTAKCLRVLSHMAIPARALVDLDFAFRQAAISRLLEADDTDLQTCKSLCPAIAATNGSQLAGDGFFAKERKRECFEALASHPEAKAPIASLHAKLRHKEIWLWTMGSIETHLGLRTKDAKERAALRSQIKANGLRDLRDPQGVTACLNWLAGGP